MKYNGLTLLGSILTVIGWLLVILSGLILFAYFGTDVFNTVNITMFGDFISIMIVLQGVFVFIIGILFITLGSIHSNTVSNNKMLKDLIKKN